MSEYSQIIEIDAGDEAINALRFTATGEYLVSGGKKGVQVRRVKDGERVATVPAKDVWRVAVSKDGQFIAAGSVWGDVWLWDAVGYKQIFAGYVGLSTIYDIDFSPDSSCLVSANSNNNTATIWDIPARKKVRVLDHGQPVFAAKYAPQGDRIATASSQSIRIWDSTYGRLLVDIGAPVDPLCGLLWFNSHIFVKTVDSKIRQFESSTGKTVAEWSVPHENSCIAMPQHGQFVAHATKENVTLWDTSTHTQRGLIPLSSDGRSIIISPDDQLLAVVQEQKIIIKDLSFIKEPDIHIGIAALDAWKTDQLEEAEVLLTAAIPTSKDTAHHVLASRALVRARLQQWDAALIDADESINTQSSAFGYIAKCAVLIGSKGPHAGCRVCDIASLRFHSDYVAILFLAKAVVLFMAREHDDAISRLDDLIAIRPLDPTFYVVQAYMLLLRGSLYMESGDHDRAILSFEDARLKLGNRKERPPLLISLISGWKFDDLAIIIQQRLCEALAAAARIKDAGESLLRMIHGEISMSESIKTWVSDFMKQCLSAPEGNDTMTSTTAGHNYVSHLMTPLLREWVRSNLMTRSWQDALAAAAGVSILFLTIVYSPDVICEDLEATGNIMNAVACFHQMSGELAQQTDHEQAEWTRDFKSRCSEKLANSGDMAANAKEYDKAISQYTIALSLNTATTPDVLGKRSKVHASKGAWEAALNDAHEVIELDPSSPAGYERKHTALHGMGRHDDATDAFNMMLLKMSESFDLEIRKQSRNYIRPEDTKEAIRTIVEKTIHDSPPVLINTISGRLCNKPEQTVAFEESPTFTELVSSMTTSIDNARIEQEVEEYFNYATFSHKWEENEPLFEKVIRIIVFELEASPTHEKLKMFCKIVREAGFNWAWSDTCCINKGDHFVLQEALVSMFKWYERSAMTLIFLRGVNRRALRGALTRSIWNKRAWTLQEYHASKVVRIYTEDWTPYLDLKIYNHKESTEIISEMEEATGISAQALMALRPGFEDIREKLRLASTRQTTRVEDAAYSLFGIFSLSIPITYGEGNKALGRFLAQLLTSSGDMSILAWTGKSGNYNSCLPGSITVFSEPVTSHIPPATFDAAIISGSRSPNSTAATLLYDQLNDLPVPSFQGRRMKLPCITFKLGRVSASRNKSERVFRAQTKGLGVVEIRTEEDLSQLHPLFLVHPWIDFLLDRQPVGNVARTILEDNTNDEQGPMVDEPQSYPIPSSPPIVPLSPQKRTLMSRIALLSGGCYSLDDTGSLLPPSTLTPSEKLARVQQFIARLRQSFGALLLTPTRGNLEYRRVAAESLITVQVKEITPEILEKLIQGVRTLDVL